MKRFSIPALAALVVLGPVAVHFVHGQKPWGSTNEGIADSIAPLTPAPDPIADVLYIARLRGDPQTGTLVSYCVEPAIRVTGRPDANNPDLKQQRPWTLPFEVALTDAAGAPAAAGFVPVAVPTPIAANTTRKLVPVPQWCALIVGASAPPEIYLQVERRRARVIFAPLPPCQRGPRRAFPRRAG